MHSRWEHFSKDELSCTGACPKCSGSDIHMNSEFMNKVVKLRKLCGFSFPITSAYRCPERNKEVSKTGLNGPHTTGKAIDISVRDSQHRKQLIEYFAPKVTGLGIAKSFIHIDLLYEEDGFEMRPNSWVY